MAFDERCNSPEITPCDMMKRRREKRSAHRIIGLCLAVKMWITFLTFITSSSWNVFPFGTGRNNPLFNLFCSLCSRPQEVLRNACLYHKGKIVNNWFWMAELRLSPGNFARESRKNGGKKERMPRNGGELLFRHFQFSHLRIFSRFLVPFSSTKKASFVCDLDKKSKHGWPTGNVFSSISSLESILITPNAASFMANWAQYWFGKRRRFRPSISTDLCHGKNSWLGIQFPTFFLSRFLLLTVFLSHLPESDFPLQTQTKALHATDWVLRGLDS